METVRFETAALGTVLTVTIVCGGAETERAQTSIFDFFSEIRIFESRFSRFLPDSELSFVNRNVGKNLFVSEEFERLWNLSETMRGKTGGYFDARVEGLLSQWGYRSEPSFASDREVPSEFSVPEFPKTREFRTNVPLDFWGIGKGVALDMTKARFAGFDNVCFVAGGDVFVKGSHESGRPFAIALEHPTDPELAIGEIRLPEGGFIAGSAANRRRWGASKNHIANPLSRTCAEGMLSVFTHGNEWWLTDAWSTVFFAMGFEKAKIAAMEQKDVECLLISKTGTVFQTPGFRWTTYSR